jgi:hypothetical protein
MSTETQPRWYGYPGHFIGAERCLFHLTSTVGPWLISTVGDYRPGREEERAAIGGEDSHFETRVFRAGDPCDGPGCGCGLPDADGPELECRRYDTAGEAQAGHLALIEEWRHRTEEPTP